MSESGNNRIRGFFPDDEGGQHDHLGGADSFEGQSDAKFFAASFGPDGELLGAGEGMADELLSHMSQAFGIDAEEILKQSGGNSVNTPFGILKLSVDAQGNLQLTQPSGDPAAPEMIEAFCRMIEVLQHLPQMQQLFKAIPGLKGFVDHLAEAAKKNQSTSGKHFKIQIGVSAAKQQPSQVQPMARLAMPFGLDFKTLSNGSYEN